MKKMSFLTLKKLMSLPNDAQCVQHIKLRSNVGILGVMIFSTLGWSFYPQFPYIPISPGAYVGKTSPVAVFVMMDWE